MYNLGAFILIQLTVQYWVLFNKWIWSRCLMHTFHSFINICSSSFLSSVFDRMETAALVAVPFELIGTMFSGIYLNLASAPRFVSWLRFISGFYYGVESISILQWDSIKSIKCVSVPGMPCIKTGPDVLNRFGYEESHFWRNCMCLAIMYFGFHTISFIMVMKRSRGTPVY